MARKTNRAGAAAGFDMPEFTLESILEEYRDTAPTPEPEEPVYYEEEPVYEELVYEEELPPEEEPAPEAPSEEEPAYEEDPLFAEALSYEEPVSEEPAPEAPAESAEPPETNFFGRQDMLEDGIFADDDTAAETAEPYEENFEDDASFYAPPAETEAEKETAEPAETETADETGEKKKRAGGKKRVGSRRSGRKDGLWGRIVGRAAAFSLRRADALTQPDPEPEDTDLEMPPRRAAKFYAGQIPNLHRRFLGACAVCLLLTWITVFYTYGLPLPGALSTARGASLVCLAGMFTVMLLGLDVVTAGVMSVVRGRFGAESMIVVASLAAALDCITMTASGTSRGVSFAVIPAFAVTIALRGARYSCLAYSDTFLALFHARDGYAVTSETDKNERILIKSRRSADGLVRRSEEPSGAEMLASSAFLPMCGVSVVLAVILAVCAGDFGAVFHLFSLLTALCLSFSWTISFPMLFARAARHLRSQGSAMVGWSGARDAGRSGRLVLTDTDIFPEDTVEITGMRVLDKKHTAEIISLTGAMLAAAETVSAAAFAELMRRQNSPELTVENFTVGEGGACADIHDVQVLVGSLGYMHLNGVKVSDKLKEENSLYTAVSGELKGVFLLRYRPMGSVQRALAELRRERRKPIFALRDFNIDPLLLQKTFGISTEGFQFPSFPERYRISGIPVKAKGIPGGMMAQDGLDTLVDFAETGSKLWFYGRVSAWSAVACTVLGMIIVAAPAVQGNWDGLAAGRILLYMLLWMDVPVLLRTTMQK